MGDLLGPRRLSANPVSLRDRFPQLSAFGVAVEWYDRYVNLALEEHELDVVLLTFVVEGNGVHVVAGEERPTTGPCLDVSRLGEPHSLVTDEQGMRVVNIYLTEERHTLPRLGDGLDEALAAVVPPAPALGGRWGRLNRLEVSDPGALLELVHRLDAAVHDPSPGRGAAVDAHLTLLLLHCAREVRRSGVVPPPRRTGRTAEAVEQVRQHLEDHFAEDHTLAALATRVGLERTSLSRAFSGQVGVPLVRYLNQRRVRAALRLLETSDLSVARTAASVGFRDLSHFNRTFAELVGVSPGRYRADRRRRRAQSDP